MHASAATIDHLFAGGLPAPAAREVVGHLLECSLCRAAARRQMSYPAAEPSTGAFSESAAEALREERELALARLRATSLWAELEPLTATERRALATAEARFREWTLVDRLLELGRDRGPGDRRAGLELAELALLLLDLLRASAFPDGLLEDKRGAVLAALASARRRTGDLNGAQRALAEARAALSQGTGDPLEAANLLELEARLQLDLGQREEALRPLRKATAVYRRLREPVREGQAILLMAQAAGHREPERGIALARRALALLDDGSEPRLCLAARHALIWFLNDAGMSHEALGVLDATRPLYRELGITAPALHQRWLEARIGRRLGDLPGAERTYRTVWREFRAAGFNQDLTLVSLDLAELFVAQGRPRRAALLVTTYESTLRRFKMHADGMATWCALRSIAADEALGAQRSLRAAALYFRHAWCRPLPFHPSPAVWA